MTDPINYKSEGATAAAPVAMEQDKARGFSDFAAAFSHGFTILRRVGTHENTSLYLADNHNARATASTESSSIVMLKVLNDDAARDPKQLELFRLEAKASARLLHKNILRAREVEKANGIYFCVIEHKPEAETLRNQLNRVACLDGNTARAIVNQIADALEHAHEKGVLHLKLQPENILVEPNGTVLVTGFGIDAMDEFSWAHEMRASRCDVQFLSPEQAGGGRVDHRSDLYSLGIILFEMLNGHVPSHSADLSRVQKNQTSHESLSAYLLCSDTPEPLSQALMGLLEKDSSSRIQDITALKTVLSKFTGFDPCAAAPTDEALSTPLANPGEGECSRLIETQPVRSSQPSVPDAGQEIDYMNSIPGSGNELYAETDSHDSASLEAPMLAVGTQYEGLDHSRVDRSCEEESSEIPIASRSKPLLDRPDREQWEIPEVPAIVPRIDVELAAARSAQNATKLDGLDGVRWPRRNAVLISALIATLGIIVLAYMRYLSNPFHQMEPPSISDRGTSSEVGNSQKTDGSAGAAQVNPLIRNDQPDSSRKELPDRALRNTQIAANVAISGRQRVKPKERLEAEQRSGADATLGSRNDRSRITSRQLQYMPKKSHRAKGAIQVELENAATEELEAERRASRMEQRPRRVEQRPRRVKPWPQ